MNVWWMVVATPFIFGGVWFYVYKGFRKKKKFHHHIGTFPSGKDKQ
jgi:hypothetical protein